MEELIKILEKFDKERDKKIKGIWDDNAVADCFGICAKEILCNGYFLVNEKYIIDLGSIELYYHEEGNGKIKDTIMYHTNDRLLMRYKEIINDPGKYQNIFDNPKNSKQVFNTIMDHKAYPYFTFGSFNLHQSGVDVTFEKGERGKEYRASFLIRSYRVFRKGDEMKVYDIEQYPFDKCSQHIFDDLFYMGISFDCKNKTPIEWVVMNEPKKNVIEFLPRINVPADKNEVQRNWRFRRINIKEQ